VEGINATRDPLVAAMNAVVDVANRVDTVDAASATGDWRKAATVRRHNAVDAPQTTALIARLPALVRAYSVALDRLRGAAQRSAVPVRLAAAVRTVVSAGQAESDAYGIFVRAVAEAWPAYAVLAGTQTLWYERASGDWYSDKKQAAQEYAVLTAPLRSATNHASQEFGSSDRARRAAAEQWATTLDQVRPILYPSPR
jgi:hypothetical protein